MHTALGMGIEKWDMQCAMQHFNSTLTLSPHRALSSLPGNPSPGLCVCLPAFFEVVGASC